MQRLGEIDPDLEITVARNDQTTLEEIAELDPERIIVSPGPCTPKQAGLSCDVIRRFGPEKPLLGVCLGHQSIAEVYGAEVVRADRLMHGKVSSVRHDEQGLFRGIENPAIATRYHSLIVPEESLPDCLMPTAWSADEGHPAELMGLRHREFPVYGVQFHPESFLTEAGIKLLENFLTL